MSEVRLIDDWREKWEERTTHGRPIVAVADIGEKIEVWALASNLGMATYGEYYLIPKPQPKKLRPWKREEVPVGSVVRHIETGDIALITGASDDCAINGYAMSHSRVFNDYVLHDLNPDGSWKPTEQCRPCGVEE